MKFTLRFEASYSGYKITRTELIQRGNNYILYIDPIQTLQDRIAATNLFYQLVDNVSKELFRIIKKTSSPTLYEAVFEGNDLDGLKCFYNQNL